ncbi:HAD-like domain-containing protein [Cynara cardunculus var. scolymus]|uniref:HAD-like domain-containing protein n=1 Tax=Cynara cardunculus var. scolymus TaxID=59895 RepID=A0A118K1V6_CYNCS|nr:HAD-like domain-containing protein [Cynara cardunculus var. scolymus]
MEILASPATPKYECLLFDMDDTLYPMSLGLNSSCRKNIEEFMLTYLKIDECQVPDMCLDLYREHGTTMAGLKVYIRYSFMFKNYLVLVKRVGSGRALGYEFDNDAFHGFVHGTLPYHLLKPDLVLRNLLLSMPQRKIIFTNADQAHAAQVLRRMCLEDCFQGVICFETLNTDQQPNLVENHHARIISSPTRIVCKPALESFQTATIIANLDPKKTIFFDDSVRNIATAKAAGFHTVIVGRSSVVAGADHALNSIHNMREALPQVWEDVYEGEQLLVQSTAVETVVNA